MNVLPAVGFGLFFLYIAKGNKLEKKKALKEAETVYAYGDLPDVIGDLQVGEKFTVQFPEIQENWILKATPPSNEVVLHDAVSGSPNYFVFKAKKKGRGAIVIHRASSEESEPLEIVEFSVEVV